MDPTILGCPICMQVLKEPRFLLCGHGFCLSCIETSMEHGYSNAGFGAVSHECPVCREEFIECVDHDPLLRMYPVEDAVEKVQGFLDQIKNESETLSVEVERAKKKNESLVEEVNELKRKFLAKDIEVSSLKRQLDTAQVMLDYETNYLKRRLETSEKLKERAYESLRVKRLRIKEMKDHATRFFETIVPERKKKKVVLKKKAKVMCACGDHEVDPDEVDPWEEPDEVEPDEVESRMDPDEVTSG